MSLDWEVFRNNSDDYDKACKAFILNQKLTEGKIQVAITKMKKTSCSLEPYEPKASIDVACKNWTSKSWHYRE